MWWIIICRWFYLLLPHQAPRHGEGLTVRLSRLNASARILFLSPRDLVSALLSIVKQGWIPGSLPTPSNLFLMS